MTGAVKKFNPDRLLLATKLRQTTVGALSEATGVSRRSISSYLSGDATPSPKTVESLGEVLRLPTSFFHGETWEMLSTESISFRSLSRMKASDRDAVRAYGTLAIQVSRWIDSQYALPAPALPDLSQEDNSELAATYVRHYWGWGHQPIPNMVHLLEKYGVRVYSLAIETDDVDASSTWDNGVPFIFLNPRKSAERGRFDVAHELAHLLLHRHGGLRAKSVEREADAFASAFLMPGEAIRAAIGPHPSLETLIKKKKVWGVSIAALAHRCHRLGLLTEWEYRSMAVEIASKGYRKVEPESIRRESSQVLGKLLPLLYEDGESRSSIAAHLSVTTRDIDTIMHGLTMTAVDGTPGTPGQRVSTDKRTVPDLRLVGNDPETTNTLRSGHSS